MGIELSRYENNWRFTVNERWRVNGRSEFDEAVKVLSTIGMKFSVEYPAFPHKEVRDIVVRETKVHRGIDKVKELMGELIDIKAKYGVVFQRQ